MTIETIALDIFQQVALYIQTLGRALHLNTNNIPHFSHTQKLSQYVVQFFLQLFYMQEYFLCSLQAISVFVTPQFTTNYGQKKNSRLYPNVFYEVVVPNAWHFGVVKYIPTYCEPKRRRRRQTINIDLGVVGTKRGRSSALFSLLTFHCTHHSTSFFAQHNNNLYQLYC